MSKVFVSYKRADKDKVFPIVDRMESELGIKFWVDLEGIDGDMQFTSVIINAIVECEVFLFMYSKAHETIIDTEKDYTVRELCFAHELSKRIVFIEIEVANLPYWFKFNFPQRQVTQANDKHSMDRLVNDIRNWLDFSQPEIIVESKPHPQATDLGLPSGTKWASYNVGAEKPEDFGGYYAWGETDEKSEYWDSNYKYYLNGKYINLGCDISGTKYDLAYMNWGGNWRMPTIKQYKELLAKCRVEWSPLNGVNGCNFTSKINGNSIFLPAAGSRMFNAIFSVGHGGSYWLSSQRPLYSKCAYSIGFGMAGAFYFNTSSRNQGCSVRPVYLQIDKPLLD